MPGSSFAKGFEPTNQYGVPYSTFRAINLIGDQKIGAALSTTVDLTYTSATIEVDASLGAIFNLTLDGNGVLGAPTNPTDGQRILFRIEQGVGSSTITWNAIYRFSTDLPEPTLTTTIYFFDLIEFIYNEEDARWDCIRIVKGFDNTPT